MLIHIDLSRLSYRYLAPEVISKHGYNHLVDYYALGVLVYELIVGSPPFVRTTHSDLFEKILHREVYFPGHLSSKCKDFLRSLLTKDPRHRLGAKEGISEIINHPWIKELNYGKIILKKVPVPVKPDPFNLNFDQEFIKVRTTGYDINQNTPSSKHRKQVTTVKPRRFENFSFYSNIDNANYKYIDALFESINVSPTLSLSPRRKDSSVGIQSPDTPTRVRKLFESKVTIQHLQNCNVTCCLF